MGEQRRTPARSKQARLPPASRARTSAQDGRAARAQRSPRFHQKKQAFLLPHYSGGPPACADGLGICAPHHASRIQCAPPPPAAPNPRGPAPNRDCEMLGRTHVPLPRPLNARARARAVPQGAVERLGRGGRAVRGRARRWRCARVGQPEAGRRCWRPANSPRPLTAPPPRSTHRHRPSPRLSAGACTPGDTC